MATLNPLCLLLDAVLSQDFAKVQEAMAEIRSLLPESRRQPESCAAAFENTSEGRVALVVDALLHHHPHLAYVPSLEDGSLPLHFAASLGYCEVARLLMEKYPEAVRIPNRKGKIPLHYAAREGRTHMVFGLLQQSPETAAIPSKKGKLALHFAVGEGHSDIVECLLKFHPQGALLRSSNKGKLPLHFCARWGHLTIAQHLLSLYPETIRTQDWEGFLPLHDAARQGQVAMCRFLLEKDPMALATATMRGEIPLFSAVRNGNLDLVVLLVQAWPRGAKYVLKHLSADDHVEQWHPSILELCLRGSYGSFEDCRVLEGRRVPVLCHVNHIFHPDGSVDKDDESNDELVIAVDDRNDSGTGPTPGRLGQWEQDTNLLAAKLPSVAQDAKSHKRTRSDTTVNVTSSKRFRREHLPISSPHTEASRFLALHTVLASGTSAHVIRHVLNQHREQLTVQDCHGQLPLHKAMAHCRSDDSVQLVLDEILRPHPEAAQVRDLAGRLPLDVALKSRADARLVEAVVEAYPPSGEGSDDKELRMDQLPLFVALENDCDFGTIYFLLRYDPSVIQSWRREP